MTHAEGKAGGLRAGVARGARGAAGALRRGFQKQRVPRGADAGAAVRAQAPGDGGAGFRRRPGSAAGQLHFAGEEFDLAVYDKNHKDELRRRCQTDLQFLCKDILGRDVTERTHGPVFAFLGNPNPDFPLEAQPDPIRERVWLDPRGTFKTSLLIDHAVQWTICFPEIRILFLGGEKSIAAGSLEAYVETFVIRGEPTRFQRLFPEFCITPNQKYEKKFVAPPRKNPKRQREPTAWSNSVDSALSGWHPDLLIVDDVENDENSENVVRVSKVKKIYYLAKQLLNKVWGREALAGTTYHPDGLNLERVKEQSEIKTSLVRAALWAREDYSADRRKELEAQLRDPNVPSAELRAEDWTLLFPEHLPFAALMNERGPSLEKFGTFCSQKLNHPMVPGGRPTFTLEAMREASIPPQLVPTAGQIFVWWDLAYSIKRGRDFYVGAVGLVDTQERLFILEIVRGRFVTHEIVHHIVQAIQRWDPWVTEIEDTNGARYLLSDLDRKAVEFRVPLRLDWVPVDSSDQAKSGRVKGCETLLHEKRLFFVNSIACMDELYLEFTGFGDQPHDDIADAISQIAARHVRPLAALTEEQRVPMELGGPLDEAEARRRMEIHDLTFGKGMYTPQEPEPEPPMNPFELEDVMPGLNG